VPCGVLDQWGVCGGGFSRATLGDLGYPGDVTIIDITQVLSIPQEHQIAKAYLQPLDLAPNEEPPWATVVMNELLTDSLGANRGAIAFQFWPESISDGSQGGWSPKQVPGGSHPLYHWTGGEGRPISFTAVFASDTPAPHALDAPISGQRLGYYDLDIRVALSWLRWFRYPFYDEGGAVYAPCKPLLVLPESKIGHDGTDYVVVAMDGCDVTYQEFWPEGQPKIVEVALSFHETVQRGGRTRFHSRADMMTSQDVVRYLSVDGVPV